jgi:hypothetical protein
MPVSSVIRKPINGTIDVFRVPIPISAATIQLALSLCKVKLGGAFVSDIE